jgi:hypothetical protein
MPVCMPVCLSVQSRVDRINSKYGDGNTVVYFEERKEKDMRLAQRLAFFAGSDVLMITPTRYQMLSFIPIHTLYHEAMTRHTMLRGASIKSCIHERCMSKHSNTANN